MLAPVEDPVGQSIVLTPRGEGWAFQQYSPSAGYCDRTVTVSEVVTR
jgi:hypothetical protein